jgi:pullulanase/glycogen debranching enzyme
MGQEIGLSKYGLDNTYNRLYVNNMNWEQVDTNFDMVSYLKMVIELRKNALPYLKLNTGKDIENLFETIYCDNGLLVFYSDKKEQLQKYQKLLIIINPTNANQTFHTDEYFASLTLAGESEVLTKNNLIPPTSFNILYVK